MDVFFCFFFNVIFTQREYLCKKETCLFIKHTCVYNESIVNNNFNNNLSNNEINSFTICQLKQN